MPVFVTGALNDHLTPWTGCYRTTELLVGTEHLRPEQRRPHRQPGQPARQPEGQLLHRRRARPDPEAWRATAEKRTGTWWEAWADWVLERSGDERPAPSATGDGDHPPLEPAPGSYVVDGVPPQQGQ